MQFSVGDVVFFKSDIEQSGVIVQIKRDSMGQKVLVLENKFGFIGEYIGGDTVTTVLASEVWAD